MPLIATQDVPRSGKRRRLGPLQRAQRVRQFFQLVTAGRLPDAALKRVGLTWWQLAEAIRTDDTGDLAKRWQAAQAFGAHALAGRAVRVTLRRVRSMPEAAAVGHRSKSLQWLAAKLNPQAYGANADAAPAVSTVHHVIHLPSRGAPPALLQVADAITAGVALALPAPSMPAERRQ